MPVQRVGRGPQAVAFSVLSRLSRALSQQRGSSHLSTQFVANALRVPICEPPGTSRRTLEPTAASPQSRLPWKSNSSSWVYFRTESPRMSITQSAFFRPHDFHMGRKPKAPATVDELMQDFGRRLSSLCDEVWGGTHKVTQTFLANKLGVSQSMVGRYFRGEAYPANNQMAYMAMQLGVYKEFLETGRGDKWVSPPRALDVLDLSGYSPTVKNAIKDLLSMTPTEGEK